MKVKNNLHIQYIYAGTVHGYIVYTAYVQYAGTVHAKTCKAGHLPRANARHFLKGGWGNEGSARPVRNVSLNPLSGKCLVL